MPWIEEEQLAKAKSVDLYSFLIVAEPQNIKRCGQDEYCLKDHDSLKVSVSGRIWHWHSKGFGGTTALQYLIKVRGYSLPEAAQIVLDCKAAPYSLLTEIPTAQPIVMPPCNDNNDMVIAYLCGKRGLHREIVEHCIAAGSLYESTYYHSCVFVGFDETGKPRHAAIRATGGDFKQDAKGSDKRHTFALQAQNKAATVLCVYEGAIDALSDVSLRLMKGQPWQDRHYLSLAGVSPLPIIQYLKLHPEIDMVKLCLDNDEPGQIAAERIEKVLLLSSPSLDVKYVSPKIGQDYNQSLQLYVKKQRAIRNMVSGVRNINRD